MEKELNNPSLKMNVMISSSISIACINFFATLLPLQAQTVDNGNIPKQREIHNSFGGEEKRGGILDATNPMQLLNRLRRANAMDDATSPSDAIDEALKAFDDEQPQNVPLEVSNTSEK